MHIQTDTLTQIRQYLTSKSVGELVDLLRSGIKTCLPATAVNGACAGFWMPKRARCFVGRRKAVKKSKETNILTLDK
jgi:hypothetical protein